MRFNFYPNDGKTKQNLLCTNYKCATNAAISAKNVQCSGRSNYSHDKSISDIDVIYTRVNILAENAYLFPPPFWNQGCQIKILISAQI